MSNSRSSESCNPQIIFGPWLKGSERVAGSCCTNVYHDFRSHVIVFAARTVPYRVTDNITVVVFLRNAVPRKLQSVG